MFGKNFTGLLANGFGYAWYNKGVGNELNYLRRFEQNETYIDSSLWFMKVTDMNRLRTYRILKDINLHEIKTQDTFSLTISFQ